MRLSRFIVMTAALAVVIMTAPASGLNRRHLRLVKSEPASDAVVKVSPTVLRLYFSEKPELRATTVKVVGKDGTAAGLGSIGRMDGDTKVVEAPFRTPPGPGTYSVSWRTMADDGHIVSGEFSFQVTAD